MPGERHEAVRSATPSLSYAAVAAAKRDRRRFAKLLVVLLSEATEVQEAPAAGHRSYRDGPRIGVQQFGMRTVQANVPQVRHGRKLASTREAPL